MGAELARVVATRFATLDGSAFKVLNRMAWTALDRSIDGRPAGLYFGGWEPLALALGFELPGTGDDSSEARRRRKKLADYVSSALAKCEAAGAFERLEEHPRAGRRQTFRLTLLPETGADAAPHSVGISSTPANGELSTPVDGDHQSPTPWGESTPTGGVPRKNKDPKKDLPQDSTPPPRYSSPSARVDACRHGERGGMRILGTGANRSRHCVKCDAEHPVAGVA